MRLLKHQSKKLLASFGLPLTQAVIVESAQEASRPATTIGGSVVLKTQVPFGGGGKAGAIKFADTPTQAVEAAHALLGMNLRDHVVKTVSIEPAISFHHEFYAGMAWDTSAKLPVALLSDAGGVEVEKLPNSI